MEGDFGALRQQLARCDWHYTHNGEWRTYSSTCTTAQNDQLVEQAIIAEQAATIAQKDKQLAELAAVII